MCKYQEIKAEIQNSYLVFIFLSQPKLYSVYSKNKGIDLADQILLGCPALASVAISRTPICDYGDRLLLLFVT